MSAFISLCPTGITCRTVWANSYPNFVGVYPDDLLPARRTTWHANMDTAFAFKPAIGGGTTFLPIGGLFGGPLGPGLGGFGPPQFDTFVSQTVIRIIFARTANRINIAHVLTQSEIDSEEINVGEFVFEAVAVTDTKEVIDLQLTEIEEQEALNRGEVLEDRSFRKLFEQDITDVRNRLVRVGRNLVGIEYRYDNATDASNLSLAPGPNGNPSNVSSRDASSKTIEADLGKAISENKPEEADDEHPEGSLQLDKERGAKAGDIVYLTYIAVREHYIRQHVRAGWQLTAVSLPPVCSGISPRVRVNNYRFYDWDIEPENSSGPPDRVSGWRIVEAFNTPSNFVAGVNALGPFGGDASLGDFVINGNKGVAVSQFLPSNSTRSQILAFQADRNSMPTYQTNHTEDLNSGSNFHLNSGTGSSLAFKNSDWFQRRLFTVYREHTDATEHVFFNVNRQTMRVRDVDKWGIDRSLAEQVELDMKSGKITFFPWMDDPRLFVTNRAPTVKAIDFLDSSNLLFSPFKPISRYGTGNAVISCGVAGGLGSGGGGSADNVLGQHRWDSNFITERFEKDTKILVEQFGTFGETRTKQISVEGIAAPINALSCFADASLQISFASHANTDGFISFEIFSRGAINQSLRKLIYRPDDPRESIDDIDDPVPSQVEDLLGASSQTGDRPGFKFGRAISMISVSSLDDLVFRTKDIEKLQEELPDGATVEPLIFREESDKLVIDLNPGYHIKTEITYTIKKSSAAKVSDRAFLIFKTGASVEEIVDVQIPASNSTIRVVHNAVKGTTIELVGARVEFMTVKNVVVHSISEIKSLDFLTSNPTVSGFDSSISLRGLLFESDVMSVSADTSGRMYIFFNDSDGGISCVSTDDYGDVWKFYYGIVEPIQGQFARHPFVVTNLEGNNCFLFFQLLDKILVKKIDFRLFRSEDAYKVEKFVDRLDVDEEVVKENLGIYSQQGRVLRRGTLSYVASGDLSDAEFLEILEAPKEKRIIETSPGVESEQEVRPNPVARGVITGFVYNDLNDFNFSAYRKKTGEMNLFYLGPVGEASDNQLQCTFSNDDGINWFDRWEFLVNGFNRVRSDGATGAAFIDRRSGSPEGLDSSDPNVPQNFEFGINIHWSRLKRHKIQGVVDVSLEEEVEELNVSSPSQTLEVAAPYVFYQTVGNAFLFYIYEQCLLCKIFSDDVLNTDLDRIKRVIERNTRAHFIDGDLTNPDLRVEIHDFYNASTNEIMAEGNIIFPYQFAIDTFNETRVVSAQRVCAYELANANVRIFYKINNIVKTALWNGSNWLVDEFLRSDAKKDIESVAIPADATKVTGGFGPDKFEAIP